MPKPSKKTAKKDKASKIEKLKKMSLKDLSVQDTSDQLKTFSNEIITELTQRFSSAQEDMTALVKDLQKQLKKAQKNASDAPADLLKEMEKKYQKQLDAMRSNFEAQIKVLTETQETILGYLPADVADSIRSLEEKAFPKKKSALKKAQDKVVKSKTVKKASAQVKAAKESVAKAAQSVGLSDLNGVGPATVKKLKAAGIESLNDIVNPSADQQKALSKFETTRGFATWKEQAQKLLK